MDTTPYWFDTAPIREFPKLERDLEVDVAVIGGGITGITAAYLLQQSGASVALLEREQFVSRDTGHTTAHLTYVTDVRLSELVRNFGENHAQAAWDAGLAAIQQIQENVKTEAIACELVSVPGYLHAPANAADADEIERLKRDAELAAQFGFDARFLDQVPYVKAPGVRFANQAKFHPRKYLAALLEIIAAKGAHVFAQSDVQEITDEPLSVNANGHSIRAKFVVIATHVPLQGVTGTVSAALFQTKLAPYSTYVVGAKIPRGSVPEASFWDTSDPYDYLRIDAHDDHDYAIYGGEDHKTGQGGDAGQHFAKLEKKLMELIPHAQIDHRWSGQVIETNDGLPFIGETAPRQFVATGFAGNGMTFGTLAAMMARDAFAGVQNPWRELFDVHRKKLHGGTWDYLRENKDYPFYFLKDRLARAEAESLESIRH